MLLDINRSKGKIAEKLRWAGGQRVYNGLGVRHQLDSDWVNKACCWLHLLGFDSWVLFPLFHISDEDACHSLLEEAWPNACYKYVDQHQGLQSQTNMLVCTLRNFQQRKGTVHRSLPKHGCVCKFNGPPNIFNTTQAGSLTIHHDSASPQINQLEGLS